MLIPKQYVLGISNIYVVNHTSENVNYCRYVDNLNVGYACITTGIYVDRIVCLKVRMHWLITSITTYNQ